MRLFVAIDVTPEVCDTLTRIQMRLRTRGLPLRWSEPESIHLTLHFLGETDPALLELLHAALQRAASSMPMLRLGLADCGVFPDARRPQVVWAGVQGDLAGLAALHQALAHELAALGLALETRPYHPHLTLARTRRDTTPEQLRRIGAAVQALDPLDGPFWQADRVILFRSDLTPAGSVYTALAAAALGQR